MCLGLLLQRIGRIENKSIRDQFLCLFSSTLEFNNLFCSFKGEGTGAVRHMFSNHILKPERTPLENSVWGTNKSSGTFSSLFESRLIPAKRYLENPFELILDRGLLDENVRTRKLVASRRIDIEVCSTWNEFRENLKGAMILNGDSSNLPIPDKSVDAVITDPPYFDFVHYSELSDFFYAWLSLILSGEDDLFKQDSSSNSGEVQHKNVTEFSNQLAKVLKECNRVLKDDGILAFSFHHSRPEAWTAILDAVVSSNFAFVNSYPVHAELRASSPKAASRSPISLDALLVCKKRDGVTRVIYSEKEVIARSQTIAANLTKGGMSLSASDLFVIAASQALVELSRTEFDFSQVVVRLESLKERVTSNPNFANI
jgi:putative DNA methylase